ncbi:MAG TPA: hypothetical protein VGR30_08540, partial [Candidatus Binatia bacterium]|nr:hypothetical protein [Candidatus Binatia bacterium]
MFRFFLIFIICFPSLLFAAPTQIRFLTWRSDAPRVWDEAIADFERLNPDLKIVREIGPHSSTEFHDLVTQKLRNRDP